MKKEYFTRFPNNYIQGDIRSKFGVSRKFYITYILIDKYRSYENYSWITIRKILEFYGYKTTKRKPKAFSEILDVLEYMINNKMIKVKQDLDSISYDTGIEIIIIPENFDYPDHFCKITSSQLNTIMMNESTINKENLLMAFLYILSYIGNRPRNSDNSEKMSCPQNQPEAFWKSVEGMAKELSMAKDTIIKCMEYKAPYHNLTNPTLLSREEMHRTFGGVIYSSDFDTEYSGKSNTESKHAGRIMSSWRFDMQCEANLAKNAGGM